jgi:hypothetical protein
MGFRQLRVINEDRVQGGMGFGTHPHRDFEIISYIISGALRHRDSMGHEAVMQAGEVQRISAGTGISHSEFNASAAEPVHFLQIWLEPSRQGVAPNYAQQSFVNAPLNALTLICSPGRRPEFHSHQPGRPAVDRKIHPLSADRRPPRLGTLIDGDLDTGGASRYADFWGGGCECFAF